MDRRHYHKINITWITSILWIVLAINGSQGACPADKFGANCSLSCHCTEVSACQENGRCDNRCSPEWGGPICQIRLENVAEGKPTDCGPKTKNDSLKSANAVDGNVDQSMMGAWIQGASGDESVYWYVDTEDEIRLFRRIKVWFYNPAEDDDSIMKRRRGYSVTISNTSDVDPENGHRCYEDDIGKTETASILDMTDCVVAGRYVFLHNVRNNDTASGQNLSSWPNLELVEVQAWADSGCSDGTYGPACEHLCNEHCLNPICDRQTGTCTDGCLGGWYTEDCSQTCSAHCIDTCNGTTGHCDQCQPGYYGDQCMANCSQNCLDGVCNKDSGTCNGDCKDGFYGDFCNTNCNLGCISACDKKTGVCTTCSDGKHGDLCELNCPSNCKDSVCHRNGTCSVGCHDDTMTGPTCNVSCSQLITDCSKCASDGISTTCSSCTNGLYGTKCNNSCPTNCMMCESETECTKCTPGFTGQTCLDKCDNLKCEECDSNSNCEVCIPGYYGNICNSTCPDCYRCNNETHCSECVKGQFLVTSTKQSICHNCSEFCLECSSQTNCTECLLGYHGSSCSKCPEHCVTCDSSSECTNCKFGWSGATCQCSGQCYQDGDVDNWCAPNGTCLLGCQDGYTGSRCQDRCDEDGFCAKCEQGNGKCQQCIPGKFSTLEFCVRDCGNCEGKACNNNDGACPGECEKGYFGRDCRKVCVGNCGDGHCEKTGGSCFMCKTPYFGTHCEMSCSLHCKGACNKTTGECEDCKSAYFGDFCEKKCPENCGPDPQPFSIDKAVLCHRAMGECLYCKTGFFGENCTKECSPNCQLEVDGPLRKSLNCRKPDGACQQCKDGFYGPKCSQSCSKNCYQRSCNMLTGDCKECESGWYGRFCETSCSDKCREDLCEQGTGNCTLGCRDGFKGQFCLTGIPLKPPETCIACIIIPVVLVAIIVVLIIGGFFFYKRRKRSRFPQHRTNGYHADLRLHPINAERDPLLYTNTNGNGMTGVNELPVPARNKKIVSMSEDEIMENGDMVPVVSNTDPSDYYNLSSLIAVDMFSEYLQTRRAEGLDWFRLDFQKLPKGLLKSCQIAMLPSSLVKCRYKQLYPYDDTRVKLDPEINFKSDFINASYIGGYKKPEAFIAAQGPTDANVNDFWRMIFQKDCGRIVMLTNLFEELKMKCVCYWPEEGSTETFGNYDVTMTKETVFPDYTVRELSVANNTTGEGKDFRLFHFTAWPDRGVPDSPSCILNFREKVMEEDSLLPDGPILVHCSAGIGRTGTFIALDYLLRQAKEERHIDVFRTITDMRYQRTSLVQTDIQYEFLHNALEEALTTQVMEVSAADFCTHYWSLLEETTDTGRTMLQEQFGVLNKMTQILDSSAFQSGAVEENVPKNRYQTIVPVDRYRAYLSTPVSGTNEYVNGVFLPTCSNKTAFIITQMPLPNTVIDFWRLVYDQHATTIVMMNNSDDNDETFGEYWPSDDSKFGPFQVELFSCENNEDFSILSFQLTYTSQSRQSKMMIRQYRIEGWSDHETVPSSTRGIIALINAVSQLRHDQPDKPTIVHCMDGAERSGLFCVLSAIFERLQMNQTVNIPQIILQLRSRRPQLILSLEQFDFCYRAVADYLGANQIYSNVP